MLKNINDLTLAQRRLQKMRYGKLLHYMDIDEWSYQSGQHCKDKRIQIDSYLIHGVINSYPVNVFPFNKRKIAYNYDCSMMTVSRAINALKRAKHIKVHHGFISLVLPKKEGNQNG